MNFYMSQCGEESSSWQVRDDLFHDPAYNTKLFELIYILEVIYNKTQAFMCRGCLDELSEVVIGTCRSWLDDDENTDYPLNPRTIIKSVFGDFSDPKDIHLKIVTSLNDEPVAVHSAGFQKLVVQPEWRREAVDRFVSHVPAEGNTPEALARQREWGYKLWYLLMGTYDADEILFNRDIVEFGTDMSQFLVILSQQYPNEGVCCPFVWPYPSAKFPTSQAAAENQEELLECILSHMEGEVEGIFRSAFKSHDLPYWLAEETNQLVILQEVTRMYSVQMELAKLKEQVLESAHGNTEYAIFEWQEGILKREWKRLPLVPIGSEVALRGYEVTRMTRIIDKALDDLDFGSLFGPVDRDVEAEAVDMGGGGEGNSEMADVGNGDEDQHTCDAGEAPAELGRYYEY